MRQFRRRITACKAIRVTPDNLEEAAHWCGGHLWAGCVVVPVQFNGKRGEMRAEVGDWIVRTPLTLTCQVWPNDRFVAEWAEFS